MNIENVIAQELSVKPHQVKAAVELLDSGCTVPFIARYRKEVTECLNDEQLRRLRERLTYLRNLVTRKEQIMDAISAQGKLTDKLKTELMNAETLSKVEDLYLPYRQKRRTRATVARERGLEPLAQLIWEQKLTKNAEETAQDFVDMEKGVPDAASALQGAADIIAENISDDASVREYVRRETRNEGYIVSKGKTPDQKTVYDAYYDFEEKASNIPGHRILALNRGEKEKILAVKLEGPDDKIKKGLARRCISGRNPYTDALLNAAVQDSYTRLIEPAVERELRGEMTERAEKGAIDVFGKNLKQLLMQPPLSGEVVMGWDPAFRTGCKLAVVDATGKVLDTAVIYPTAPTNEKKQADAKKKLREFISRYHVTVISLGNGTASRESEAFIADFLKEIPERVSYVIVNEAGASVYSASELAAKEFPEYDVGLRSAVSIARRLQDPLAELVKIDPKSIGVGQYQHDLNQKKLDETLDGVIEDCVNSVGVDLNTASAALLGHISGITKITAANIVSYRESNGRFKKRSELLKVPKLGPKAYEQSAGFLRILDGTDPLDATSVHPESYQAAKSLIDLLGFTAQDIASDSMIRQIRKLNTKEKEKLAGQIKIGLPTLEDVLKELEKPGRDIREDMPKPILRSDVLEMKDLKSGMILKGTVRNVIDFGAFVDIGVHQDGLVHISELSDKGFVKHPLDVVGIGDVVEVRVLKVDLEKKRIALSMKKEQKNGLGDK